MDLQGNTFFKNPFVIRSFISFMTVITKMVLCVTCMLCTILLQRVIPGARASSCSFRGDRNDFEAYGADS